MSALELHFYFDFVCPYAYLASLRVERIAEDAGVKLVHAPMLLGGVFRTIGAPDAPRMSPPRAQYTVLDLSRQAERAGVTLKQPEGHPRRTVLALRAAIASSDLALATRALYEAYWARGEDLEDASVVERALTRAGLDGAAALAKANDPGAKDALRRSTETAVRLGIFGAPAMVVVSETGAELFWGNDRLHFVERALQRDSSVHGDPAPPRASSGKVFDFYFDFSSPFAYLASTQIRRLAARTGARIEYRPLLLGGLFKAIGTSNVPLFEMPMAKQQYVGVDLDRWAKYWGAPFRFASRFPINTTKALRAVLLAPVERRAELVHALFAAVWADDRDITNDTTLGELLSAARCDAASILAELGNEAVKTKLKEATSDAEARGVFGVPTFFVGNEMFWGQDRLDWVGEALAGHA